MRARRSLPPTPFARITLRWLGKGYAAHELTKRAVATAQEAIAEIGQPARVAGSSASLEDCYRPDPCRPMTNACTERLKRIHHLIEVGVDLLLIETMNSIREAVIAAKLAMSTGLPTLVSFVCDRGGPNLIWRVGGGAAEICSAGSEGPGRELRPGPHSG